METKKWYQSVTIWSDVVTFVIALCSVLATFNIITPDLATKISGAIAILAGAIGINGRVTATTKIG